MVSTLLLVLKAVTACLLATPMVGHAREMGSPASSPVPWAAPSSAPLTQPSSAPGPRLSTSRPAPVRHPSTTRPAPLDREPGPTAAEAAIASEVVAAINSARAQAKLPALVVNSALQRSARAHDLNMSLQNTMSHQLPGEAGLGSRISAQGLSWNYVAENIGWTTQRDAGGALSVESMMLNETAPNDGHRKNLLSTSARSVGVDVLIDAAHGKLWLTEDFAG